GRTNQKANQMGSILRPGHTPQGNYLFKCRLYLRRNPAAVRGSGVNGIDRNTLPSDGGTQTDGKSFYCAFAGGVGQFVGHGTYALAGGEVDDAAGCPRRKAAHKFMAQQRHGPYVDGIMAIQGVCIQRINAPVFAMSGVVDQDMDGPKRGVRLVEEMSGRFRPG